MNREPHQPEGNTMPRHVTALFAGMIGPLLRASLATTPGPEANTTNQQEKKNEQR